MIVDISQEPNKVVASYSTKNGEIALKSFNVKEINGYGTYDYQICDEADPEKHPKLRHFKDDLPIKRIPSYRFDFDELREFLLTQISDEDRKEIFEFNIPKMYMCDIEIDIQDGDVFPDPVKAEYPIDSIQITAPDFNTVVLTTNKRALRDEKQMMEIEDMINEHYADVPEMWKFTKRIKYAHIVFDSEIEMLEYYWKVTLLKLHSQAFWAGGRFDVPYLNNRCAKLGISLASGSPTGEISSMHSWPKHRFVFDYMELVAKWAIDIMPLVSVSLEHVTNKIFGVGKVKYEGSYKDLYHGPIKRFLFYGAVDTINMQLIHNVKNYTVSKDSLVFYTKTTMFDSTKVTAQVHALCWDELYVENKINAEPYEKKFKKPYEGGYVKNPARKFAMFPVCVDFSALYPRIMQSFNMSFENFMGQVKNDDHKKKLINDGYYVSVDGNYYKNDKDYTLKKIEDKMLHERYAYKGLQNEVYLNGLSKIEDEFRRRKLQIPSK